MNKLQHIIELLSLSEESNAEWASYDKFLIAKKNYFTIEISSDVNDNIFAKVTFKKKIAKDRLEYISAKLSKINSVRSLSGFSITSSNNISKQWFFSALEEDENVAFALSLYLSDLYEISNY